MICELQNSTRPFGPPQASDSGRRNPTLPARVVAGERRGDCFYTG